MMRLPASFAFEKSLPNWKEATRQNKTASEVHRSDGPRSQTDKAPAPPAPASLLMFKGDERTAGTITCMKQTAVAFCGCNRSAAVLPCPSSCVQSKRLRIEEGERERDPRSLARINLRIPPAAISRAIPFTVLYLPSSLLPCSSAPATWMEGGREEGKGKLFPYYCHQCKTFCSPTDRGRELATERTTDDRGASSDCPDEER